MMKIEIEPTTRGSRGQRYRVMYQGEVLCESTRNPEHDACRALLNRGIIGTLECWHLGATYAASRIDIERGAKWTVYEGDRQGLYLAEWMPAPPDRIKMTPACTSQNAETAIFEK